MHLVESYAIGCQAKISKPNLFTKYYPLPFEKYITVHFSSGMESKNYDYWPVVMKIIFPALRKAGYQIVQIGGENDLKIGEVPIHRLCGKTEILQTNDIIRRSSLHIANDTFSVHVAGAFDVPLLALYTVSPPEVCGPYWKNEAKTVLLESHRNGNKPSYANFEPDKTVNLIKIEDIVNNIYKLLELNETFNYRTVFVGEKFANGTSITDINALIELVPESLFYPRYELTYPISTRLDMLTTNVNWHSLFEQLNICQLAIITKQIVPIELLSHPNCKMLIFEITKENYNLEYFKFIHKHKINYTLIYKDEMTEFVNDKKLELCEFTIARKIDYYKPNFTIKPEQFYISSRFIHSNGKFYTTQDNMLKNQTTINTIEIRPAQELIAANEGDFETLEQLKFSLVLEKI